MINNVRQGEPLPTPGEQFILSEDGCEVIAILVKKGEVSIGWWLGRLTGLDANKCYSNLPINKKELHRLDFDPFTARDGRIVIVQKNDPRVTVEWSQRVREGVAKLEQNKKCMIVCDGDHPLDLD